MARRRRRSFGAVARGGSSYRGKTLRPHTLRVCVLVYRNIGASNARQYTAHAAACKGGKRMARGRYGSGAGRTPTAATKKALRAFASKVR